MDAVLALNAGSATLKFALYRTDMTLLARGLVDHWGADAQRFTARDGEGASLFDGVLPDAPDDRQAAVGFLLDWVAGRWPDAQIAAVGHRIVHGGADFAGPVVVDEAVLAKLEALSPLAPLHQPAGLAGLRLARAACPQAPQTASFDTAFHRTMPDIAARFALPAAFWDEGVRRYGFHGLSYRHVAEVLKRDEPALAAGRVIVAHLGGGASLCALKGGVSLDTTMGFSALDGLVMSTRSGSIDPGVLLYFLQQRGMSADEVSDLLYRRSGLLGVSGISGDMRALLASAEPAAKAAVALYVHRIVREIGALAAMLGGLDGLVFTAGVGENAPQIRDAVCERLGWLGEIAVRVIATDEEQVIAAEALAAAGL